MATNLCIYYIHSLKKCISGFKFLDEGILTVVYFSIGWILDNTSLLHNLTCIVKASIPLEFKGPPSPLTPSCKKWYALHCIMQPVLVHSKEQIIYFRQAGKWTDPNQNCDNTNFAYMVITPGNILHFLTLSSWKTHYGSTWHSRMPGNFFGRVHLPPPKSKK